MRRKFIIVGILLSFVLISGLYYAATNSVTSDELTHVTTGYIYLCFNDYRFNIEHPPLVKQLAALPLLFLKLDFPFSIYHEAIRNEDIVKIQNAFLFGKGNNLDLILFMARLPNILMAVLLGLFIYLYSKKLNGIWAGMISLILFVFSPSFLGHSPLVTMDTTVSFFYLVTIYYLMKFFETNQNLYLSLTGMSLGLGLISKFSALILIPVIYILTSLYAFNCISQERKLKNYLFLLPLLLLVCSYKTSFKFIAPALFAFICFSIFANKADISAKSRYACCIMLVILTIAFTFIIIDYTDFKWFPFHSATKAYFKGFSSFEGHAKCGQGDAYLLGMHSSKGWWYYFPLAILFKEPFAFLIIFFLGLFSLFMKKGNILSKSSLILPPFAYLMVAMFANRVDIGIRHILPVYPFLFIIAGYSVILARKMIWMKLALPVLIVMLVIDVSAAYPMHLSYFNRLAGGIDNGHKLLSDSNLAWGQDWKRLKDYIEKNGLLEVKIDAVFAPPDRGEYYHIPYRLLTDEERICPAKGFYAVDRVVLASGKITWADKIKPCYYAGGSLLVYDIKEEDVDYCKCRRNPK